MMHAPGGITVRRPHEDRWVSELPVAIAVATLAASLRRRDAT